MKTSVLLAIYNHPDQYPPTANTISLLSERFHKVYLLHRPNAEAELNFDENVIVSPWQRQESSKATFLEKVLQFASFVLKFRRIVNDHTPDLIVVHDNLALYALHLVLKTTRIKSTLWYHNHDIPQLEIIRKYSIGWFASKVDPKIFPRLHLFSVPSEERMDAFPVALLRGQSFVIPNFPMLKDRSGLEDARPDDAFKIIFQGKITWERGIEEMVKFLRVGQSRLNRPVHLVLKGPMDSKFKPALDVLIDEYQVADLIQIKGVGPYSEVVLETMNCHVGLAGIKPVGVNYQSAGTASNKIYEYASCGLPIIYFKTPHYEKYLGQYSWAFGCDLEVESIGQILTDIAEDFDKYSKAARLEFESSLNYEKAMKPVLTFLSRSLG